MARIQGYSEDDVDLLIVDFARIIQDAALRTATRVADALGQPVTASGHVFHLPGKHNQKAHGHKVTVSADQQSEFHERLGESLAFEDAYDECVSTDDFLAGGDAHMPGRDMGASAREYQADAYVINGDLREGRPESEYPDVIDDFDAAFEHEHSMLTEDIMVERGIEHPGRVWGSSWSETRSNVGLTWDDDGFVSTTTSHSLASSFAAQRSDTRLKPVRMRMLVPAGTHAIKMGHQGTIKSYVDGEKEIVLPRGMRFRVMADHGTGKDGIHDVDVEVLGLSGDVVATLPPRGSGLVAAGQSRIPNSIDRGPEVRVLRFALFEQPDGTYTAPDMVDDGLIAASSANLTPYDIAVTTQLWQEEVDGVLTSYITDVYTGSATQVAIGLGTAFSDSVQPGVPLLPDQFALTYLGTLTNQLSGVGNEMWEDIRNELLDGVKNGDSIEQIAARVKAVGNMTTSSATTIARTHIHSAAEAGSITQLRFIGYADDEVDKEWLTVHDARVRETHVHADHQTVSLNEKFTVGGWPLDHPGDMTAPASEVANCRCTVVFNIDTAPMMRCEPSLVADSVTATECIVPVPAASISHLTNAEQKLVWDEFAHAGITPAYGGAKIRKVIDDVLTNLQKTHPTLVATLDRDKVITIIDKHYAAKKSTFGQVYHAWAQSPAGKKALGIPKPKLQAVKTSIALESKVATPIPHFKELPPILPKPDVSTLTYTGKTLGSHGAQVWVDDVGNRWLFKPQQDWATDLDIAIAKLQSKALLDRPAIYKMTLHGKTGSLQYMFQSTDAFPGGSFSVASLSAEDIAVFEREQIFDWMISNFDTHSGQWIRLKETGQLYGTDKGQAFKFFGKDKLSWDYVPVTPLSPDKLTYTRIWQDFVAGKNVPLTDPTQGELGTFIDHLMSIPDDVYRELLTPYAKFRESIGLGSAQKFLDAAVARKNSLKSDFAVLWKQALEARAKSMGVPIPTPTPAVVTPSFGGISGDISKFDHFFKSDVVEMWVTLGKGKKVTPAWGGSKIYKMVTELRANMILQDPSLDVSELQLLRILDEMVPAKAKYETTVLDWLDSAAGKKAVPNPVPSLHHISVAPTPVIATPVATVQPVVPVAAVIPDDAGSVLATGKLAHLGDLFTNLKDYGNGEVVGYLKTIEGDTVRLTRYGPNEVVAHVRYDSLGEMKWAESGLFDQPEGIALKWNLDTAYYAVAKSKLASKTATHVPGLLPGDDVTFMQIIEHKFAWDDGDIIATATDAFGSKYRLVAHGDGSMLIEGQVDEGSSWISISAVSKDTPQAVALNIGKAYKWKLGPDVLVSKTPSKLTGFNVGDVIQSTKIVDAATGLQHSDVIAYAYDAATNTEYRLRKGHSHYILQSKRIVGTVEWEPMGAVSTKDLHKQTWHVAKTNGDAPAEHLAEIGKKGTKSSGPIPSIPSAPTPEAPPVPTSAVFSNKIPGKSVGDIVTNVEIFDGSSQFDDGVIIAMGEAWKNGKKVKYRALKVDGQLLTQKQTASGSWTGTSVVASKWSIYGHIKWKVANVGESVVTKPQLTAMKKVVAKYKGTHTSIPSPVKTQPSGYKPKVGPKPAVAPAPVVPFEMAHVDITPWSDVEQLEIYILFKSKSVYISSDPSSVWNALQAVKYEMQKKHGGKYLHLNEIEILRIADLQGAKKFGVVDTHPFEAKVVNWLKTPAGKSYINKKIDAPIATIDVPVPMEDFSAATIAPEAQKYEQITLAQAKTFRAESEAKYGPPTATQKNALKKYTGGSYSSWNNAIRTGNISTHRADIIAAQTGMRPSTRPMLLHRGTSFLELNDPSIISYETLLSHVGETYTNRGFMSTSVGGHAAFGGSLLIEVEAPIGTPMAYVADFSNHPGERETTLAAHLIFRIIGVKKNGSQTVMRVRVIGVAQP
jgi:hypothetical protein